MTRNRTRQGAAAQDAAALLRLKGGAAPIRAFGPDSPGIFLNRKIGGLALFADFWLGSGLDAGDVLRVADEDQQRQDRPKQHHAAMPETQHPERR